MFRVYSLILSSAEPPSMAAANTTASTVLSTVTAASATAVAAEAASAPAAATSAGVKAASVPTTTAGDKQDIEKLTTKLASNLSTKGKFNGLVLRIDCKSCSYFFLHK